MVAQIAAVVGKLSKDFAGAGGFEGGRITRANLDGSGPEIFYEVAPGVQENISKVALDMVHSRLFWSDSLGGRILSRDLTGGPPAVILDLPSSFDGALEVDPFQGHVYFTTGSFVAATAKIERVNFDGSDRRIIANTYAASMGLDLVNERLYAADWDAHRIRRVDFDGTGLITVIPRVIAPRDVQVFGDKMYFPNILSEAPDGTGPYHFQWVRTTLDGANREVLWQVPRLDGPHDMIQFAVVVPEPGTAVIAILLGTTVVALRKQRCSAYH